MIDIESAVGEIARQTTAESSDRELLQRFIEHRDESAFEALLRRHQRGVWGVCRRVLPRHQDAEDAFQAVFLVLARKAASIHKREALGSWLYGVAYRTALRLRQGLAQQARVSSWFPFASAQSRPVRSDPSQEAAFQELQMTLDEEVQRLPAKFRAPFVLCCLEGMSRSDAAHELGLKEGTLSGRLAQGRHLLHRRLARRGVSLSATLTALALVQSTAAAAPPATLVGGTAHAVLAPLAGKAAATTASPPVIALANAVVKALAMAKLHAAVAAVLSCAVFALIAGAAVLQILDQPPADQPPAKKGNAPLVTAPGQSDVWSIAVSADGKLIAAGAGWWDQPGEIGIWELATRNPLKHFAEDLGVAAVAFSPDGKLLASGSWSGHVRVRDWAAGKQTADLKVAGVARLAFAPDSALLATVTERETAQLWDPASDQLVAELEGDPKSSPPVSYACVAFSADGQQILAGGNDWKQDGRNQIIVWDVASQKKVRQLTGHRNAILCLACSPDGKLIASGGADHTIRLWDAHSGQHLKTLQGHQHWVESVVFTDEGKTVVSGSHDGTVRFWNVTDGKERARVDVRQAPWRPRKGTAGPSGRVRAVRLTPDGQTLLVGSGPRSLTLFDAVTHKPTDSLWQSTATEEVAKVAANPAPSQPNRPAMDDLPAVPPSDATPFSGSALLLVLALVGLLSLGFGAVLYLRRRRLAARDSSAPPALAVSFRCPACGKSLKAKPELAGSKSKCPKCGEPVVIPKPDHSARGVESI